ncbi:hypothetical protein [Azospirillum sp. Marseille-Q6669]
MALPESGEEFRRGSQITLTFEASAELNALMRRWSDEIPTLYFVDICVANITKRPRVAVEGNARKAALFDRLKELDKQQNSFSYLLALAEKVSDSRSKLSDAELEEQILLDVAALRAFFVNAHVVEPDEFLVSYARELRRTPHELSQHAYIQFLQVANDRFALGNPVARRLRFQKAEEILREADTLSIARRHPVVLVTLGCLYGNLFARKLMKFKADTALFDAENALADIMIISRFLPRKLEIEQLGREGKVNFLRSDFITDDSGLADILNCFVGEAVRSESKGDVHQTQISVTVNFELLFPELFSSTGEKTDQTEGTTQSRLSEPEKLLELLAF